MSVAYSIYNKNKDPLWLAVLSMTVFWCLGFALQVSGTDIKTISFWYIISNDFIGVKSAHRLAVMGADGYGQKKLVTPFRVIALFLVPAATIY